MKNLIYALLLLPSLGFAQSVQGVVNGSWVNPTTASDGTALTGTQALTKIQVFLSSASIPDLSTMVPTLELGPGATTGTVTLTVPNHSTLYFRVKACNSAGCGAFSNQSTKPVDVNAVPGIATSVTFTITITP